MAIYQYKKTGRAKGCLTCNEGFDVFQQMSDAPLAKCPDCGARVERILGRARSMTDLGRDFGCGLTEAELDYLVRYEWARTSADVLWRRSKLGLQAPDMSADAVTSYLNSKHGFMGDQWISSPHF